MIPDTRNTLILRLPDTGDIEAWDQFVEIYEPLVYRLARSKGFQDADAREIVQEVLLAVSKAVEDFDPNPELGRFRDWLFRIARNLMIKFMTRRKYKSIANGGSSMMQMLDQQLAPESQHSAEFDLEYRREVFRWAASQVEANVQPTTWQAFWLTSIEGTPIAEAAGQLGITTGAVHIARSRVRGRLSQLVKRFGEHDQPHQSTNPQPNSSDDEVKS